MPTEEEIREMLEGTHKGRLLLEWLYPPEDEVSGYLGGGTGFDAQGRRQFTVGRNPSTPSSVMSDVQIGDAGGGSIDQSLSDPNWGTGPNADLLNIPQSSREGSLIREEALLPLSETTGTPFSGRSIAREAVADARNVAGFSEESAEREAAADARNVAGQTMVNRPSLSPAAAYIAERKAEREAERNNVPIISAPVGPHKRRPTTEEKIKAGDPYPDGFWRRMFPKARIEYTYPEDYEDPRGDMIDQLLRNKNY